jgi:microcystin-dependent protein
MDEYLGIIKLFAGNFAPQGWMYCNGALLSISQNTALFSLLGTTYGGDGMTTFGLPDLRGRVALGYNAGSPGPGLPNYALGQLGGETNHTLIQTEMPQHIHGIAATTTNASTGTPGNTVFIATPGGLSGRTFTATLGFDTTAPNTMLSPGSITPTGGSQPHNNMQPYLALGYIICVSGLYPSRP